MARGAAGKPRLQGAGQPDAPPVLAASPGPRLAGTFMIAKTLTPGKGAQLFAIMENGRRITASKSPRSSVGPPRSSD